MKGYDGDVDLPSVFSLAESVVPILKELERTVGTDDILATMKEIDETDRSIEKWG